MDKIVKVPIENGYFLFKLGQLLKDRNISINKIMRDTNTDFYVIKRYMTGDTTKFDMNVIARFCNYLDCTIHDIIEYINDD